MNMNIKIVVSLTLNVQLQEIGKQWPRLYISMQNQVIQDKPKITKPNDLKFQRNIYSCKCTMNEFFKIIIFMVQKNSCWIYINKILYIFLVMMVLNLLKSIECFFIGFYLFFSLNCLISKKPTVICTSRLTKHSYAPNNIKQYSIQN